MKIYKVSQKELILYETFGLEDVIINGFKKMYGKLFDINPLSKNKLQKNFETIGYYHLGNLFLPTNIMQAIFNKYGEPKIEIPSAISLFVSHSVPENNGRAWFGINKNGDYCIGIDAFDIFNVYYQKKYYLFEEYIGHEIQHFIRSLYVKDKVIPNAKNNNFIKFMQFHGNDSEIQSYSYNIARAAIHTIQQLYSNVIKISDSLEVLNKLKITKDDLIQKYLFLNIKKFINARESQYKIKIPEDIKIKYYDTSTKNFSNMFDKWIEGQIKKYEW
jgi:hypothetical protein